MFTVFCRKKQKYTEEGNRRMRGNGFKSKSRCRLDIRRKFSTMRVVEHLNRFPIEAVEAPFLEIIQGQA